MKKLIIALVCASVFTAPGYAASGFSKSGSNSSRTTSSKTSSPASPTRDKSYKPTRVEVPDRKPSSANTSWGSQTTHDPARKAAAVAGATALGAILYQSTKSAAAAETYEAQQRPTPASRVPEPVERSAGYKSAQAPDHPVSESPKASYQERRARDFEAMARSDREKAKQDEMDRLAYEQRRAQRDRELTAERLRIAERELQIEQIRSAARAREASRAKEAASAAAVVGAASVVGAKPPVATDSHPSPDAAPTAPTSSAPAPITLTEKPSALGMGWLLVGVLIAILVCSFFALSGSGFRRSKGALDAPVTKTVHYTL